MAFIESPRFPECALLGATFSPVWSTDVTMYGSGAEQRNANWQYPLSRCNLPMLDVLEDIETVREYFMAAQGRLDGFRVKDFSDYKSTDVGGVISSTDQIIGTGDGTTTEFQIIKTYYFGTKTSVRQIKKPVAGTVVVSLIEPGSPATAYDPLDWTVDTTTGIITFGSPPPASGFEVACGYEFDVPMRFDTDALDVRFLEPEVLGIDSIPLMELRL